MFSIHCSRGGHGYPWHILSPPIRQVLIQYLSTRLTLSLFAPSPSLSMLVVWTFNAATSFRTNLEPSQCSGTLWFRAICFQIFRLVELTLSGRRRLRCGFSKISYNRKIHIDVDSQLKPPTIDSVQSSPCIHHQCPYSATLDEIIVTMIELFTGRIHNEWDVIASSLFTSIR